MQCDVLVVGASTGGFAAAIAAADAGATVILTEETRWLGGQLTTQGVSTPDENAYIETFSGTRRYQNFRQAVRSWYRSMYRLSAAAAETPYFNPGNCWVSRLSYEPKVGVQILERMAAPLVESGRLRILYGAVATGCALDESRARIDSVSFVLASGEEAAITATWFLDGTDLGDLIALCGEEGRDWVVGAESRQETGEPDAPETARPEWVQPFTFPFAIEWSPDSADTNRIERPADYDELKAMQRYHVKHGAITGLFEGAMPWWRYRRLLAAANFDDPRITHDLSMINTAGNDYYGGSILGSQAGDANDQLLTLARARRASSGYLYWLQNEYPREDDPAGLKVGYPEFRLRADMFDTNDGCAIMPYIRESRRIRSVRTILEQEIVVRDFSGNVCRGENTRAAAMPDSVGVGHYALDIHPNGHGEPNHYVPTRPFQIPLGALIPVRLTNLLPACKNLGTTHLTNGAYRLHPIEWNVGEAAGLLAACCLRTGRTPLAIRDDPTAMRTFQRELLRQGIALHWLVDVPLSHPAFEAAQMLASAVPAVCAETDLLFRPDDPITPEAWESWRDALEPSGCEHRSDHPFEGTRAEAAATLYKTPLH